MKTFSIFSIIACFLVAIVSPAFSQDGSTPPPPPPPPPPAKVDYVAFMGISEEVYDYREARKIGIETFNTYATEANTIILDTRSQRAYAAIHMKGAVHLNFSDFTKESLAELIPDKNTRILIYCNNNFESSFEELRSKSLPLALNIPTFINLYGYGYKNIYELQDLLKDDDERVVLEGWRIDQKKSSKIESNSKK